MRLRVAVVALASVIMLAPAGCTSKGAASGVAPSGGAGWSVRPSVPVVDPSAPFDLNAALDVIRHQDYTPDVPDKPLPGPLRAIRAICTGSINGRCMQVFFFNGQQLVGGIDAGLVEVVSQNGTEVVLSFPQYRHGDPGCCPSGGEVRHTVRLGNGGTVADPPIPADSNNYGTS